MQPATKDISLRGARIRFLDAGRGAPLVLVHDFLGDHQLFAKAVAPLAASFRVIAPDLPGFGASEKPDPRQYAYGYDAFAESIVDLLATLGLGRVHVCGHGMGGGVALTLAAQHPALVHRLVLVDATVFPPNEGALDRLGRAPVLGGLVWRQAMGQSLFRGYVHATTYAGARPIQERGRIDDLFRTFNTPEARQAAHATLVATADTRPLVAKLPRVSAETLVVWGRDDRVGSVEQGRRLARELRGRFEVLECGRCPPDELPNPFASTVISFLDATTARPPAVTADVASAWAKRTRGGVSKDAS